ncbi:hypothetical protein [Flavobacterium sp.]|uniref:hypothetical protein n=1 Tax=Flavobacterium sp. TaxID=239 RepID=UPI0040475375
MFNFADRRVGPVNARAQFWGRNVGRAIKYGIPAIKSAYSLNTYVKGRKAPLAIMPAKAYVRRAKRKSFPKKVKSQIRELRRLAESDMGTHIQRKRQTGVITSAVGSSSHNSLATSSITNLEEVIAQLRYYNPSAPSTLVTADGTTGTYQKEFFFNKVYGKLTVRNNYQVPAKVTVYSVSPKADTSIAPSTAFTQGLTDIGNPSNVSPLVYLTDSVQFKDLYKINKTKSKTLMPGQQLVCSHSAKPFQYDPSFVDSHAITYQAKFKAMLWVIRLEGVLGHDSSVTTEHNLLQAAIDYENEITFQVKYAAGADIHYIHLDDVSDTFTNAGVVSQKPVADNQSYSVS